MLRSCVQKDWWSHGRHIALLCPFFSVESRLNLNLCAHCSVYQFWQLKTSCHQVVIDLIHGEFRILAFVVSSLPGLSRDLRAVRKSTQYAMLLMMRMNIGLLMSARSSREALLLHMVTTHPYSSLFYFFPHFAHHTAVILTLAPYQPSLGTCLHQLTQCGMVSEHFSPALPAVCHAFSAFCHLANLCLLCLFSTCPDNLRQCCTLEMQKHSSSASTFGAIRRGDIPELIVWSKKMCLGSDRPDDQTVRPRAELHTGSIRFHSVALVRQKRVEGTINKDMTNHGMTFEAHKQIVKPLSQTCDHIWRASVRSEKKCACVRMLPSRSWQLPLSGRDDYEWKPAGTLSIWLSDRIRKKIAEVAAREHRKTYHVERTKKMVPFVTRETPSG